MSPSSYRSFFIAVAALLGAMPACAQPTTDDLQREIQKRDAIINGLAKRLTALEQQVHGTASSAAATPVQPRGQTAAVAPAPASGPTAPAAGVLAATTGGSASAGAPASAISPGPAVAAASGGVAVARAGATQPAQGDDDEVLVRALENTLVDRGAQVLDPWVMQIVPDTSYMYQSLNQLSYVNLGNGVTLYPVTQRSREDLLEAGLSFRLGLPWESQISVRVPVAWYSAQATFAADQTVHSNASGLGDISVNVSKQVVHEQGYVPDVLLNVAYSANTGNSSFSRAQISTFPFAVGTGSGFDNLSAGVTLLKRQDPLVFLGGVSYIHSFSNSFNGITVQPGNAVDVRVGPILAASPDAALRIIFDTQFQSREIIGHRTVPGSDQVISMLEFGAGISLTSRVFLDAAVAIGVTSESPAFRAGVSLPIRF